MARVPKPALAVGACLALAALSLLLPSTPTYDPWAWIIWGREILQLDLDTETGPSWKPLPVLFTTILGLGPDDAVPALWLVVARAGALLALLAAFRLARRMAGGPLGVAAGLFAVIALFLSVGFVRNAWLGNSEGLLVACALFALDRHLSGRRDQAFALAFAAGLLRPEVWPFLGLYGVWLWIREPARRPLVAGAFVLLPALWFLPELWGSGDPLRASARANTPDPGSPAFADHPALEILRRARFMVVAPVLALFAFGTATALAGSGPGRERRAEVLFAAGAALALLGLVALMTQAGYAGNTRYLMLPVALGCVVAGVGFAHAGEIAAAAAARVSSPLGRTAAAAAILAVTALAAPSLLYRADAIRDHARVLEYEADLNGDLEGAVARAGGTRAVLACGPATTGRYQVPVLAWQLGVHAERVEYERPATGVVFRAAATPTATMVPKREEIHSGFRPLGREGGWELYRDCTRPPSVAQGGD